MYHSDLQFGSSQVAITPRERIPLGGFAYRENQPFTDIASDLHVKAFVFRVSNRTRCLIIADILWWPPEWIASIRKDVNGRWGIEAADLLLHATHTHSAPQTSTRFAAGLGLLNPDWQQVLLDSVTEAIGLAMHTLRSARISRFLGPSAVSMNRRVDKGVDHATADWPDGVIDRDVTTLLFEDVFGESLGALIHFACHPTILRGAIVSAEFPGVVCARIAKHLGVTGAVGFLQGCSGDIGPVTERIGQQPATTFPEVVRIGELLAADVIASLRGEAETIIPDSQPGKLVDVPLPFEAIPTHEELVQCSREDDYLGEWAQCLLERNEPLQDQAVLEIQQFRLGSELSIVGFNAEMVSHYGELAKSLGQGTILPCGYSNGMIGYVVTDNQLENGGYEVDESTKYFALPSRFAHGNEQLINEALRRICSS